MIGSLLYSPQHNMTTRSVESPQKHFTNDSAYKQIALARIYRIYATTFPLGGLHRPDKPYYSVHLLWDVDVS